MLCLNQLAWVHPIDKYIQQKWIKWKLNLKKLQEVDLDRCYKPKRFVKVVGCSLHHFSNTSESGYGQATYLKIISNMSRFMELSYMKVL